MSTLCTAFYWRISELFSNLSTADDLPVSQWRAAVRSSELDGPQIRRRGRGALVRDAYEVSEAASAQEATSHLSARAPELVLLDLGLPDRDGMELVPLAKQAGAAVLILSARDATSEKVAALDLGADDYVTKPFDTQELLARVRTCLRHRRSGVMTATILKVGDIEIDADRRSKIGRASCRERVCQYV